MLLHYRFIKAKPAAFLKMKQSLNFAKFRKTITTKNTYENDSLCKLLPTGGSEPLFYLR